MKDRSWTMIVPNWHPAAINEWEGKHWSVRHRLKKRDKSVIFGAKLEQKIPEATTKRRIQFIIGLTKGAKGKDPDAYFKSGCDSLVANRLLVNDSKEWVELSPVQYERTGKKYTRIILTDL